MPDESVLTSVKRVLGIAEANTDFDAELIHHINYALFDLQMLGVGYWRRDFGVASALDKWDDVVGFPETPPHAVVEFVAMKVKKAFDPTTSTAQNAALDSIISSLEWRVQLWAENADV